jgi:hypothetical protein
MIDAPMIRHPHLHFSSQKNVTYFIIDINLPLSMKSTPGSGFVSAADSRHTETPVLQLGEFPLRCGRRESKTLTADAGKGLLFISDRHRIGVSNWIQI